MEFKRGDTVYKVRGCAYLWFPMKVVGDHYLKGYMIVSNPQGLQLSVRRSDCSLWPAVARRGASFRVRWNDITYQDRSVEKKPEKIVRVLLRRFKTAARFGALQLAPNSTDTIMSGKFGGKNFFILGV